MIKYFLILFFAFFLPNSATAKQFKNAYITFDIPDRWECALEVTEWVCRSQESEESKQAIIVFTAKEVGPSDSIQIYSEHVRNPIFAKNKLGQQVASVVMSPPSLKKINGLTWVDGFHQSSEIQNYYTRYMATIKEKIAVLVTFTAHKDFYTKYSADFFKTINSLNVTANKISIQNPIEQKSEGSLAPIPSAIDTINIPGLDAPAGPIAKKSNKFIFIMGAIIFAALGLILLLKRKKKK